MKQYTIDTGQHDFRPRDGIGIIPWFWLKKKALVVEVKFDESCLYFFTHPWNKLPGISLNPPWKKKNQYGIMLGCRTAPNGREIQLNPYANYNFDHQVYWHDAGDQENATISPGDSVIYITWFEAKNRVVMKLFKREGNYLKKSQAINGQCYFEWWNRYPWFYTPIGLWFGGPEPAPQPMKLWMNRRWEKVDELKRKGLIV